MASIPSFNLDAATWTCENDFYDAFFQVVGAPEWHGRNLDALNDSIVTGGINKIEAPYQIIITNLHVAPVAVQRFAVTLERLFRRFQEKDCPVTLELRSRPSMDFSAFSSFGS